MQEKSLLEMRGIYKSFPGVKALTNVDFTLREGEIHALMGENGAGKSTLIKVLTGVYGKDSGDIYIKGHSSHVQIHSPQEAQNAGISTVYQEISLCPNLSVAENIFIGRGKKGLVNWKNMNRRAGELLDSLGIAVKPTQQLASCSIAVQQMVANPIGADGRFIVKYDCEAGTWAEANPEIGETFTFAIDFTGSWLADWVNANDNRGIAINKWSSRDGFDGDAVRLKRISGDIWGMTANFAQQAVGGWADAALMNDSVTTVYGQFFGFVVGGDWWQWDGHDIETTQAVGTDGLFQFAPSTGVKDADFMTADMEGEMYGYNRKGYAEPCAEKIPFDHDLYNPAEATISNTYFATGDAWAADEASSAALDNETGNITVHIAAPKANQWQSQVFFTLIGIPSDTTGWMVGG